jgi:hypothetical protein
MTSQEETLALTLQVEVGEGSDTEELDRLARQLLHELRELEVESADLVTTGRAPEGAKSAEAVTMGMLAVTVLPTVLPKMLEFLQAWMLRGQGRTLKFKGKVGGEDIEIEGATPDELKALLAALSASRTAKSEPSESST